MNENCADSVECHDPQHVLLTHSFWRRLAAWAGLTAIMCVIAYLTPSILRQDRERAAERTLSMVLGAMERGVVVVNEDGIIELFSPAAEKLFRVKAADAIGTKPGWMVPKEMAELHRSGWLKFSQNPHNEVKIITCTAMRWDETEFRIRMRLQPVAQVDGGYKIVAEIEEEKPITHVELP